MTPTQPNWLGPFFGSDLSFQDCEVLTIQNIPRKTLKEETALMQTKWFDYRRLHPLHSTYFFMHCYTLAYREFVRVAVDMDKAPYAKPIKGNDFLENRERLAFWRLRQLADKLGIRYDFFLNRSMKWYMEECFRRESLYAPRPGHIATNEELLATVMMAWEEEVATRLQVPADPWYKVANFTGDVHQLAQEAFAVAQVNGHQHKRFSLSSLIYEHDILRVEEAIRQFGPDLVEDAMNEAKLPR